MGMLGVEMRKGRGVIMGMELVMMRGRGYWRMNDEWVIFSW